MKTPPSSEEQWQEAVLAYVTENGDDTLFKPMLHAFVRTSKGVVSASDPVNPVQMAVNALEAAGKLWVAPDAYGEIEKLSLREPARESEQDGLKDKEWNRGK